MGCPYYFTELYKRHMRLKVHKIHFLSFDYQPNIASTKCICSGIYWYFIGMWFSLICGLSNWLQVEKQWFNNANFSNCCSAVERKKENLLMRTKSSHLNYACSDDRYSYLEGMNYYSIFNENRHMHINSQWHVHINTKTEYWGGCLISSWGY